MADKIVNSSEIKSRDVNKKCLKIPEGDQNPYIEEQTTQRPKEKVQKEKQQSTKHTYNTKCRVT